jgi:hypothetical protein
MKLSIVIALVATLLAVPGRANAEFTPDEARAIRHLREAALDLSTGLRDYLSPLMNTATNDQTRPLLGAAMRDALIASREASIALGLLLNVVTEQHGSPPFAHLAALSRAERVAQAWWRCDRAIMYIEGARSGLAAAARLDRSNAAYQDAVRRAANVWFVSALADLQAVDRSLAYTNPNPRSFPQIVGPHGNFESAQWMLWRSQHYAHDAMDGIVVAYLGPKLRSYVGSAEVIRRLLLARDISVDAMILLAGVTWADQQVREGEFFRTLEVLQALTDDDELPKRWMEAITALGSFWLPAMSADPVTTQYVRGALIRIADAWKHADNAAWQLMIFPDCAKLKNPQGCGGR